MLALIDADLVAFRCAASCEKQGVVHEPYDIAVARAVNLLNNICIATNSTDSAQLFLSSSSNFRKHVAPTYKANRTAKAPEYLAALKEWMVDEYGAISQDGLEADDLLGIWQTRNPDDTIICTLDKDLRQVPGNHYSWEISGTSSLGKPWVRPEEKLVVSPREGLFNFYWQLIMGDNSDNVPGFDGVARKTVPKFLNPVYEEMQMMDTEQELFNFVRSKYNDDGRLINNGICLWILREEDDNWLNHAHNLMGENGPPLDGKPLSSQPSEQELDAGLLNMKP